MKPETLYLIDSDPQNVLDIATKLFPSLWGTYTLDTKVNPSDYKLEDAMATEVCIYGDYMEATGYDDHKNKLKIRNDESLAFNLKKELEVMLLKSCYSKDRCDAIEMFISKTDLVKQPLVINKDSFLNNDDYNDPEKVLEMMNIPEGATIGIRLELFDADYGRLRFDGKTPIMSLQLYHILRSTHPVFLYIDPGTYYYKNEINLNYNYFFHSNEPVNVLEMELCSYNKDACQKICNNIKYIINNNVDNEYGKRLLKK